MATVLWPPFMPEGVVEQLGEWEVSEGVRVVVEPWRSCPALAVPNVRGRASKSNPSQGWRGGGWRTSVFGRGRGGWGVGVWRLGALETRRSTLTDLTIGAHAGQSGELQHVTGLELS